MRNYQKTIENAMNWINSQMLTFDQGYYGIYERIRIDKHIRTNWSRPDCNAEYLRVLANHQELTGECKYTSLEEKLLSWLERIQQEEEETIWRGSFPFYVIDGYIREEKVGNTIYQNDNGKILISMCCLYKQRGDKRYLTIAEKLAAYWMNIQQEDGTYGVRDGRTVVECRKGPCFVQWLTIGYYYMYEILQKEMYLKAAEKGMEYLMGMILPDGRVRTSYEIIKFEDWRPVSSETGIMLYVLSVAWRITNNECYKSQLDKVGNYFLNLQTENGAIKNCNQSCQGVSLQNDENLCDFVYTVGFALQALLEAYESTGEIKYYTAAVKLADYLVDSQCEGESPLWDGGWRGSRNIHTGKWSGRANQNNPIDEGGMYSVYTGWCCTNIMLGMQKLTKIERTRKVDHEMDTQTA